MAEVSKSTIRKAARREKRHSVVDVSQIILSECDNTKDYIIPTGTPDEGLYHYTSSEGLLGIIQSNSIRFSDCMFLNDGSEVHYANKLLTNAVDRFVKNKPTMVRNFAEELRDITIATAVHHRPIVFCLSSKPNLLNQWRDYGRDIVPYCVEFDQDEFLTDDWSFRCQLVKMVYDEILQNELLDTLIDKIYRIVRPNLKTIFLNGEMENVKHSILIGIWGALVRFKNPSFEAEQEWRLLSYPAYLVGQDVQFRTTSLGIVPFFSRYPRLGTQLPIKKIWVGPSPWGSVSTQALQLLLQARGYDVLTETSDIPAR